MYIFHFFEELIISLTYFETLLGKLNIINESLIISFHELSPLYSIISSLLNVSDSLTE